MFVRASPCLCRLQASQGPPSLLVDVKRLRIDNDTMLAKVAEGQGELAACTKRLHVECQVRMWCACGTAFQSNVAGCGALWRGAGAGSTGAQDAAGGAVCQAAGMCASEVCVVEVSFFSTKILQNREYVLQFAKVLAQKQTSCSS